MTIPREIEEIGLFADVHGEYMNIDRIADDCPSIQHWICLGDLIDKDVATHSNQPTIRMAQKLGVQGVLGNHEQKTIDRRLSDYDRESQGFLSSLPDRLDISFGDLKITAIHYVPGDRTAMKSLDRMVPFGTSHDLYCQRFESASEDFFVVGHTHIRHDLRLEHTRILNPGSLAGKGSGSASFAILARDGDCRFEDL